MRPCVSVMVHNIIDCSGNKHEADHNTAVCPCDARTLPGPRSEYPLLTLQKCTRRLTIVAAFADFGFVVSKNVRQEKLCLSYALTGSGTWLSVRLTASFLFFFSTLLFRCAHILLVHYLLYPTDIVWYQVIICSTFFFGLDCPALSTRPNLVGFCHPTLTLLCFA